jgi:oxygen-independent coproporphyrinogen III oxidase
MRGLYLHVPFCGRKCGYCDFDSAPYSAGTADAWLAALEKEAPAYAGLRGGFATLFAGGGTPTALSAPQLRRLLAAAEGLAGPLSGLREATFEANPETLDEEKASLLRAAGVNRVSLGLQAAQDRLLAELGRRSTKEDFLRAWKLLRGAGFDNLGADLMCGLPGQTEADFRESLGLLLELGAEHVSFYALEVHEGTPFHAAGVKERPELAADLYEAGTGLLEKAGLRRYEISNFARPGRECLHNLNYWRQGEYLGLGPSAASYLAGVRRANPPGAEEYIAAGGRPLPAYEEKLEGRALRAERLMLGLRLADGMELESDIISEFKGELDSLRGRGLIEYDGRRARIKKDRFYLSNAVFREFV